MSSNESNFQELQKILIKNDYLVRVKGSDSSCLINLPTKRTPTHIENYEVCYTLRDTELQINEDKHVVPNYALRTYVYYDIALRCKLHTFHPILVSYFNTAKNQKVDNIYEILSPIINDQSL